MSGHAMETQGRVISTFLIVLIAFFVDRADATAPAQTCLRALEEVISEQFELRINQQQNRLYRNILKRHLHELESEIAKEVEIQCREVCTVEEQTRAVATAIETVLSRPQNQNGPSARSFGFLIGALATQVGLMTWYTTSLEPITASALTALTTFFTMNILYGLSAPIMERLSNLATRASYSSNELARHVMEKYYESIALRSRQILSPIAQGGRGVQTNALAHYFLPTFYAVQYQFSSHPEVAVERSARLLGQLVVFLRRSYPDVDLTHHDFKDWAQAILVQTSLTESNYFSLFQAILREVRLRDPQFSSEHYERVLAWWLRPHSTLFQNGNGSRVVEIDP